MNESINSAIVDLTLKLRQGVDLPPRDYNLYWGRMTAFELTFFDTITREIIEKKKATAVGVIL